MEKSKVSRATILLVDDDAEVREVIAEALELSNYSVMQADSGEAALSLVQATPEIDLIVTDVCMDGMSGLDMLDEIERRGKNVHAIVISGYYLPRQVTSRTLRKPFSTRQLMAAVEQELSQ